MNSNGLKSPYPIYATNDENIVALYKVSVTAEPILRYRRRPCYKHVETETKDNVIFDEDLETLAEHLADIAENLQ